MTVTVADCYLVPQPRRMELECTFSRTFGLKKILRPHIDLCNPFSYMGSSHGNPNRVFRRRRRAWVGGSLEKNDFLLELGGKLVFCKMHISTNVATQELLQFSVDDVECLRSEMFSRPLLQARYTFVTIERFRLSGSSMNPASQQRITNSISLSSTAIRYNPWWPFCVP